MHRSDAAAVEVEGIGVWREWRRVEIGVAATLFSIFFVDFAQASNIKFT